MMKATEEVARFAANLNFDNLPGEVIDDAKRFVLETAAATLLGSTSWVSRKLVNMLKSFEEKPEAPLIGVGAKMSCRSAAFYNAFALDFYDCGGGHDNAVVHPGKNVVPAAVTVASALGKSGRDLIAAVVAGIEIEDRIDLAMLPSHILRGHYDDGTVGCLGAAAAVGKLFDLDETAMADALGNAGAIGPLTLGGLSMFRAPIRSAAIGQGTASAVFAAMLAKDGIGGVRDTLESPGGFCSSTSDGYDLTKITSGFGKEWQIRNSYFKPYLGCRLSHAVRECALVLRERHKLNLEEIERVIVKTNEVANAVLDFHSTPEMMEMHVTVCGPYFIAAALLYGEVGPKLATEECLKDPRIYELMKKIEMVVDPSVSLAFISGGCVEVITKDSRKFSHTVKDPDWSSNRRPTDDQLAEKFRTYASGILDKEQIEEAIKMSFRLEEVGDVSKLVDLYCPIK